MKRSVIILLIVAALCVVAGLVLCGIAWAVAGFDIRAFGSEKFTQNTHNVTESFDRIKVKSLSGDIIIRPSQDGKCSVVTSDSEKCFFDVKVLGDTLTVEERDVRKWYEHIGIFFHDERAAVIYLPEAEYVKLHLKSGSGDISVADGITFGNGQISSSSGEINIRADFAYKPYLSSTVEFTGMLEIGASSGDISLSGVSAQGITANTSSGDISLDGVSVEGDITLKTSSGEAELESSVAKGMFKVKTSSGDIELGSCDAGEFDLRSSSGDIEGSLASGKMFDAYSSSGRVRVPQSTEGAGACKVHTSSGDIEIRVR